MSQTCEHPDEMMVPDAPHQLRGLVGEGFICTRCGFQTLRVETYQPVVKPCPRCGAEFEGMPDVADEICPDCFSTRLREWIANGMRDEPA